MRRELLTAAAVLGAIGGAALLIVLGASPPGGGLTGAANTTDVTFSCYNQLTTLTTGTFCQVGPFVNAATLKDCTYTNEVLGGGTGTETIILATASGCASGVLATVSEAGNAAAFTATAATINASAIAANSSLFACVTVNATTANVAGTLACHYTRP